MIEYAEMTIGDYDEVHNLWGRSEGVGLDPDDTREGIQQYLGRNPGLSFVARDVDRLVVAVLYGHDGRRGYLHHLAVYSEYRKQGIGKALVDRCMTVLKDIGIPKCNIFVFKDNEEGIAFWLRTGWVDRSDWDLTLMQKLTDSGC